MQATPAARRLTKRVAKGLTGRVAAPTSRQIAIIAVPATVTIVWLIAVLTLGEFDRAVDRWESALTMVFGSFLAGSTPAGAGAVAFPVFTKALDIVPEVARTFTLSIQAIGLTVSLGVSTYPTHGRDRESLLDTADKAMYRAKSRGRNRVCSASDLDE